MRTVMPCSRARATKVRGWRVLRGVFFHLCTFLSSSVVLASDLRFRPTLHVAMRIVAYLTTTCDCSVKA
jgi:hypothetical protein